jgi:hypothetical protein
MQAWANTPEELESLLEDGFIQRDTRAIARLFRPNGLLLVDDFSTGDVARLSAGSEQIRQTAVTLCRKNFVYLAETRWIWQVGGIALLMGACAVNVAQRDQGGWRYLISHLHDYRQAAADDPHCWVTATCNAG